MRKRHDVQDLSSERSLTVTLRSGNVMNPYESPLLEEQHGGCLFHFHVGESECSEITGDGPELDMSSNLKLAWCALTGADCPVALLVSLELRQRTRRLGIWTC